MKIYLENLLPRLKEYSLSLDKQEVFVDKPWVIIDKENNKQTYIFQRNGNIIMSLNGQVTVGKWEYISAAKSLLIDRIQDKILLNQNFIDPAIMVLKMDGLKDENFILANVDLIPDLDILNYLKELYYRKNRIEIRRSEKGELLEFNRKNSLYTSFLNTLVTIEGEPVKDGRYELEESNKKYILEDGYVVKILISYLYRIKKGNILIEQQEFMGPTIGDTVLQNNIIAVDGNYRLEFMKHIIVKDGKISKITFF